MDRKQYITIIFLLGSLSAIGPFSTDMYLPAFLAIARGLKTDIAHVGLSLTSYFIGISAGQLVWGPLVDRYGRKKPLLTGLMIYIAAAIGCACSPSANFLIVLRLFQAVGGCVGIVGARAVVRDMFSGKEAARVLSTIVLVFGVSPIIAPTIGGFVAVAFGWRFIFLILTAIAAFVFAMVVKYLGESKAPDSDISLHPKRVVLDYISLFKEPVFLTYTCVASLSMGGFFAYISGSPLVFMKLNGLSATQFGWVFGANAVGLIIASQLNRGFLRLRGSAQILLVVISIQSTLALGLLAWSFAFPSNGTGVIVLLSGLVFCQGLINPNSMALALEPFARKTGFAAAFMGSMQQLIGAVASGLVSYLYDGTARPMIWVMTGCAVLALTILTRWHCRKTSKT
jgi:DHA1 family bicyclomycin/chloramphenicol resistance-like MFS transporter